MLDWITNYFADWEWNLFWPEVLGKATGVALGVILSWFLVVRKRIQSMLRLQQGDSDDVLFQAHYLHPLDNSQIQLLFRNVAEKRTIEQIYDNPAAVSLIRQLGDETSLNNPILPTQQTIGFEVLNDAAGWISGALATSPGARNVWLFCLTCEDRSVVRKRCVRAFMIRPDDLQKFHDWQWCRNNVSVERPWHWFRVVALHRVARALADQSRVFSPNSNQASQASQSAMPLVDDQVAHRRIIPLALGLPENDCPIGPPIEINWPSHLQSGPAKQLSLEEGNWPGDLVIN